MSTISITAPAVRPVRTATRLRLTARGRRVLLALAAVPLAIGIGFEPWLADMVSASGA